MTAGRVLIVGASVGGVRTAQALRGNGFNGEIDLLDQETELPFDKPPLSKSVLSGKSDVESIRLLTQEGANKLGVGLLLGVRATGVDWKAKLLHTERRGQLAYDRLVVATGAAARPSPWGAGPGLHVVRTLDDCRALAAAMAGGGPLAVVGSGFIGAEIAATARELGLEVHLIDPLPAPMGRALEPEVGRIFTDLHVRHGVDCRFGVGVDAIDGGLGDFSIRLSDGATLKAGVVVVGIGARPNTAWLADSGLTISDGLVCDEYLRTVDESAIFALGDAARWPHRRHGLVRLAHWTNAVDQATCVAHNIAFPEDLIRSDPVEYVWTDQYNWKIQIIGQTIGAAAAQTLGDVGSGRFAVLYADPDGILIGRVAVNWPRALISCRKAVRARALSTDVAEGLAAHTSAGEVRV